MTLSNSKARRSPSARRRRVVAAHVRLHGLPVPGVSITYGKFKGAVSDEEGRYLIPNLPLDAKLGTRAPGYQPANVSATVSKIELTPGSLTIQVNEAGNPDKHVAKADIRQGTTSLGTTNDGGNTVISPYPGKDAKLLICAAGYDQKEITIHGVVGTFEITPGTNACPPLPTPTPAPSPSLSPSASPGASPSSSPTPSPTASP